MHWGPRVMNRTTNKPVPSRVIAAIDRAQSRARSHRRKAATVTAAALAGFMGYHVVFGNNGLIAYQHKRQDTKALQVQMHELELENERRRGHVDRLQNDPGAIEHQAREELHYTRAGEVIYTLPNEPSPPRTPPASKAQ